jgi:hypothetical protein
MTIAERYISSQSQMLKKNNKKKKKRKKKKALTSTPIIGSWGYLSWDFNF